ncbi:hypothetical protein B0T17DRAFT_39853 [Bombardia bombarda]|uniref:Uncharacterized protein n=1 Tax=Bombardia bombarda TaxID=252184 RepID=A0AA40CFF9_9PEZI|nr:hypothetical protein B0T17DRAFT_39853 [Bombardia bombarda]
MSRHFVIWFCCMILWGVAQTLWPQILDFLPVTKTATPIPFLAKKESGKRCIYRMWCKKPLPMAAMIANPKEKESCAGDRARQKYIGILLLLGRQIDAMGSY